MFRREIRTDYTYHVSSSLLWDILTDFPRYPEWNHFIFQIHGHADVGARIRFKFELPRGIRLPATAIILTVMIEKELRWKGRFPIPGLFSAEHYFIFETSEDTCHMHHGEIFRGLTVPFLWPILKLKGTPVYRQNNIDLNNRATQLLQNISHEKTTP